MTINRVFQTKMFALIAILSLYLIYYFSSRDFGINKTVGWAYNFREISYVITCLLCFLSTTIYGILAILKWKTNTLLSILHFSLILLSIIFDHLLNYDLVMWLNLISMLTLVGNLILSIRNRNKNGKLKTSL